jgi:hypothetical protein
MHIMKPNILIPQGRKPESHIAHASLAVLNVYMMHLVATWAEARRQGPYSENNIRGRVRWAAASAYHLSGTSRSDCHNVLTSTCLSISL